MDNLEERHDYHQRMMNLFRSTERQFLEFDEIVPMTTNEHTVNSPKLYFTLLTTCGQIESVMNEICKTLYGPDKKYNFPDSYEKLNEDKVLDNISIQVIKTRDIYKPFSDISWWKAYNKAKHELPKGIEHSTISNVISALGALYLLLHFVGSIPLEEPQSILKLERWRLDAEPIHIETSYNKTNKIVKTSRTNLFALNSYFLQSEC